MIPVQLPPSQGPTSLPIAPFCTSIVKFPFAFIRFEATPEL